MARVRTAGPGPRAGRIVRRFGEVVIKGRRECYSFTARRSTRREHRNGRLDDRFGDGIVDIACHGVGVELAVGFLFVAARRRGFGGRGWPECVQIDRGYAPSTSLDDSARASKIMPTAKLSPQANFRSSGIVGRVSEGGNDTNAESSTGAMQRSPRRAI